MEIRFVSRKLGRQLREQRQRVRAFGWVRANRLAERLDELAAAATLREISRFPPARLHGLLGDRAGLWAVDVTANWRLIFAGANDYGSRTTDDAETTKVLIVGIEDYH
ncbi:type II toxin-antitoxin system RelE/ParE family toxin [Lacticaseibacillus suihuaensis]